MLIFIYFSASDLLIMKRSEYYFKRKKKCNVTSGKFWRILKLEEEENN